MKEIGHFRSIPTIARHLSENTFFGVMRTNLLFPKGKKIFEKMESEDVDQGDGKILQFVRPQKHSYEFLKLMSKC